LSTNQWVEVTLHGLMTVGKALLSHSPTDTAKPPVPVPEQVASVVEQVSKTPNHPSPPLPTCSI
jgi:hypothetical protein